ncbi:MAG: dihydrolipoyl dehydrogenase [Myxococcota bacterium]
MSNANSIRHVNVAIIGAGTAGLVARRNARENGASVVMIDPGPFGTTCARVGCMPSKLLIAAADAAHHARTAAPFGVVVPEVTIDGRAVLRRVQAERDRFVGFVDETIEQARRDGELVQGRAKVVAPGRLAVDLGGGRQQAITFDQLVIAAGGASFVPPPFRGLEHVLLTNENVFELDTLPDSVAVIGLGVIGLELGQALHRLGVRTTLLGVGGTVGPLRDPEVAAYAQRSLAASLDLHPDYELRGVTPVQGGVELEFVDSKGVARREQFERILIAAGRRSNLPNLGLEHLGVRAQADGRYRVDPRTLQLEAAPVFIAGDANGLHPLLHEAADDGRIAGTNAANFPDVAAAPRRVPLAVVFTDPQMAVVGIGYDQLGECEALAGQVDYADQGRARVQGIADGLVRIYAEKNTGQLLGAEMFGPRVEHMAHLLAWAIENKMTATEALKMPFYHPVLEEGLRTALRDLAANLRHGAPMKCAVEEFGPST